MISFFFPWLLWFKRTLATIVSNIKSTNHIEQTPMGSSLWVFLPLVHSLLIFAYTLLPSNLLWKIMKNLFILWNLFVDSFSMKIWCSRHSRAKEKPFKKFINVFLPHILRLLVWFELKTINVMFCYSFLGENKRRKHSKWAIQSGRKREKRKITKSHDEIWNKMHAKEH